VRRPSATSAQSSSSNGTEAVSRRSDGEVREKSIAEGQESDARTETRDAAERPIREEGHEPQTGDRDWSVRGAAIRWEGAAQEVVLAEEVIVSQALFIEEALKSQSRRDIGEAAQNPLQTPPNSVLDN
jgi:hypothetical protein